MRKNLITARQKKGLTQIEISEKIGISPRQYQNLEAGTSDSSVKTWQKLKDVLNVQSIDYLLIDDTNQEKHNTEQKSNQERE